MVPQYRGIKTIIVAVGRKRLKDDHLKQPLLLYVSRNKADGENGGDEDSELETTAFLRENSSIERKLGVR
jgi:hypothetical protein